MSVYNVEIVAFGAFRCIEQTLRRIQQSWVDAHSFVQELYVPADDLIPSLLVTRKNDLSIERLEISEKCEEKEDRSPHIFHLMIKCKEGDGFLMVTGE